MYIVNYSTAKPDLQSFLAKQLVGPGLTGQHLIYLNLHYRQT